MNFDYWNSLKNTFQNLDPSSVPLNKLVNLIATTEAQLMRDQAERERIRNDKSLSSLTNESPGVWAPVIIEYQKLNGQSPPDGFYDVVRQTLEKCYAELRHRENIKENKAQQPY